ncbi:MAG: hypothetical protein ISR91_06635 [Candidatus Delongbacteria bacterium]|nr:hypothetical protein [bacterium]MBL7033805.1 hypothetical protein [Candidatus Delongbacteria bacterium]
MTFCTTINCIDGRVQLPVVQFLQKRFNALYVDSITEPGPVKLLATEQEGRAVASIFARVEVSLQHHDSVGIAIVAHHDCAGNPLPQAEQLLQLERAVTLTRDLWPRATIIGLWVDEQWQVSEVF